MLPLAITAWADRYHISQPIMWEIVETVTDGTDLHNIRDESHLFDLTVEWVEAMIEMTAEDGTSSAYQAFILYYLPIVFALASYLSPDQKTRFQAACYGDRLLRRGIDLMLNRDEQSPNDPASLR